MYQGLSRQSCGRSRFPRHQTPAAKTFLIFKVNGYVAGRILSEKGTLFVATEARVDAEIEVGMAVISGTVNGNVIGHERVELSPGAVIMGNISTNSLAVRPGAFFHGDCCVWSEKNGDK